MGASRRNVRLPWWVYAFLALGCLSLLGLVLAIPLLLVPTPPADHGEGTPATATGDTAATGPATTAGTVAPAVSAPDISQSVSRSDAAYVGQAEPAAAAIQQPSATQHQTPPGTGTAAVPPPDHTPPVQDPAELETFRAQVEERIAAAGDTHTAEMKDAAREVLKRLTGILRITTLRFAAGDIGLSEQNGALLLAALETPNVKSFLDAHPSSRFIVLGFADPAGSPEVNARLSRDRAKAVATILKNEFPERRSYAFGLGATQLLDAQNLEQNRAVEVWLAIDTK